MLQRYCFIIFFSSSIKANYFYCLSFVQIMAFSLRSSILKIKHFQIQDRVDRTQFSILDFFYVNHVRIVENFNLTKETYDIQHHCQIRKNVVTDVICKQSFTHDWKVFLWRPVLSEELNMLRYHYSKVFALLWLFYFRP